MNFLKFLKEDETEDKIKDEPKTSADLPPEVKKYIPEDSEDDIESNIEHDPDLEEPNDDHIQFAPEEGFDEEEEDVVNDEDKPKDDSVETSDTPKEDEEVKDETEQTNDEAKEVSKFLDMLDSEKSEEDDYISNDYINVRSTNEVSSIVNLIKDKSSKNSIAFSDEIKNDFKTNIIETFTKFKESLDTNSKDADGFTIESWVNVCQRIESFVKNFIIHNDRFQSVKKMDIGKDIPEIEDFLVSMFESPVRKSDYSEQDIKEFPISTIIVAKVLADKTFDVDNAMENIFDNIEQSFFKVFGTKESEKSPEVPAEDSESF